MHSKFWLNARNWKFYIVDFYGFCYIPLKAFRLYSSMQFINSWISLILLGLAFKLGYGKSRVPFILWLVYLHYYVDNFLGTLPSYHLLQGISAWANGDTNCCQSYMSLWDLFNLLISGDSFSDLRVLPHTNWYSAKNLRGSIHGSPEISFCVSSFSLVLLSHRF